jgi:predicted RNA binding protein YcfA (HicA-like mRNA interferase family)
MKSFKEMRKNLEESKIGGKKYKDVTAWIKKNGFEMHRDNGKEPIYKHSVTGQTLRGINKHAGAVDIGAMRNIKRDLKQHSVNHSVPYYDL